MNRLEADVFHRFLAQPEVITAEGIIKTTDYNGNIIDCYCRLLKVLIATGAHSVYAIYMMRSLGEKPMRSQILTHGPTISLLPTALMEKSSIPIAIS